MGQTTFWYLWCFSPWAGALSWWIRSNLFRYLVLKKIWQHRNKYTGMHLLGYTSSLPHHRDKSNAVLTSKSEGTYHQDYQIPYLWLLTPEMIPAQISLATGQWALFRMNINKPKVWGSWCLLHTGLLHVSQGKGVFQEFSLKGVRKLESSFHNSNSLRRPWGQGMCLKPL